MNVPDEPLTDKEIDARREAGLKKLLAMPPKPHRPKAPTTKRTARKKKPKAD